MNPPINKFKCKRCGKCCLDIGTLWAGAINHPLIEPVADFMHARDLSEDDGDCMWLTFEGKTAVCLIEKYLGRKHKPAHCRDFPEEFGDCRFKK